MSECGKQPSRTVKFRNVGEGEKVSQKHQQQANDTHTLGETKEIESCTAAAEDASTKLHKVRNLRCRATRTLSSSTRKKPNTLRVHVILLQRRGR